MKKTMEQRMKEVEEILTKMFQLCPTTYDEFNIKIKTTDKKTLLETERENTKLSLAKIEGEYQGISTLSIIATITDILCDKRLGVKINFDEENNPKEIIGAGFIKE